MQIESARATRRNLAQLRARGLHPPKGEASLTDIVWVRKGAPQ
jgi:hypothetical protein